MNPIGALTSAHGLQNPAQIQPGRGPAPAALPDDLSAGGPSRADGFSNLLDNVVSAVDGKENQAESITAKVLLGDSSQLHQSVIAMQEASTALSLMVAVRNKLVESYQELMRMQA